MLSKGNQGLTNKQASQKLKKFGLNEIQKKKKISWSKLILDQFKSPLIYILFFAGITSLVLGEITDSIVVFLAVIVNTGLGFFQEFKAEKSLQKLKNKVTPQATVIRDGQEKEIEAAKLVPGDIVVIKSGQSIPADGELIDESDLQVNEAFLTGESRPVSKDIKKKNEVYLGSNVVSGTATVKVTKTGSDTRMGQLAEDLEGTVSEQTPLKKQVKQLAKNLTIGFAIICVIVFIEGLWRSRPVVEMLNLAVSLAVAAVPEGLAISVTMILALGMERISKENGLVRKLLAAESLGAVDLICLDKTGTLTEGRMRVVETELEDEDLAPYAVLCANSEVNAVDVALKNWGRQNSSLTLAECNQHKMYPFQSKRKFSAGWIKKGNQDKFFVYGAPELMMKWSNLTKQEEKKWERKLEKGAQKGYRAIGLAYFPVKNKPDEKWKDLSQGVDGGVDLIWLGLIFMADPLRAEVKQSLQKTKKAGIEMKVITGDYFHTAIAVMNQLGLATPGELKQGKAMSGEALGKIPVNSLAGRVEEIKLFYRTQPEQKIKIVKALQSNNHTVAMMGDGVNDALALKKADIGIVVGEATDVAKETADMVLMDSKFSTIVAAIKEGRIIFNNIKKVVTFLLTSSFSEAILLSLSFLLKLPLPITAAQILWVNLVEDSLPSLALAFEKSNHDLLNQKPRKKNSPILDREMKTIIFIVGLVTDFLLFGLFCFLLKNAYPLSIIRTMIFAGLALDSLFFVFSTKSLTKNIWETKTFDNHYLNGGVIIGIVLLLLAIYLPPMNYIFKTIPLSLSQLFLVAGLSLVDLIGIELVKLKFK